MPPTWVFDEMEERETKSMPFLLPKKGKQSNGTRTVRFDTDNVVRYEVPCHHRKEISEEELQELWYVEDDYHRINSWIRITTKNMKKGLPETDDYYCYRGLENRVHSKQTTITRSIYAVLNEQTRQREANKPNAELLAEVYRGFSIACQLDGYKLAKQDAAAAKAIYKHEKSKHSKAKRRNSFLMEAEDVQQQAEPELQKPSKYWMRPKVQAPNDSTPRRVGFRLSAIKQIVRNSSIKVVARTTSMARRRPSL